jgi:predicted O-linked N-acetylglucosamine transferase (SPINDLY family)
MNTPHLTAQEAFKKATTLHRAGRLKQAEEMYLLVLESMPEHADANHLLGIVYYQAGIYGKAEKYIKAAIRIKPDHPFYHNNLGNVLKLQDDLAGAVTCFEKAIHLKPDYAEPYNNLGITLKAQGKSNEAIAALQRAVKLIPQYAEAYYNLGNVILDKGKLEEAVVSYKKALQHKPEYLEAHYNLGKVLKELGQLDEAAESFQKAISYRKDYAEAHNNLGNIFQEQDKLSEATDSFRQALRYRPGYAEAHLNLGITLQKMGKLETALASIKKALSINNAYGEAYIAQGNVQRKQSRFAEAVSSARQAIDIKPENADAYFLFGKIFAQQGSLDEAIKHYQQALAIKNDYVEVYNEIGNILLDKGQFTDAVETYRQGLSIRPDSSELHNNLGNVLKAMGCLEESVASFKQALAINPRNALVHSNMLFVLNYFSTISQQEIYRESLQFDRQHGLQVRPDEPQYENSLEKQKKLRIGYVSPDFKAHSVAFFIEPVINGHNRNDVEIFCYASVPIPDKVTQRFQAAADHWRSIVNMRDKDVVELIQHDQIDILVDLAGHTARNLLIFGYQPAPVQVTWIGYPNTTGMQAIDYRLTDAVADPVGEADKLHSEKLVRLEHGFLCYQAPPTALDIGPLPCRERGYVTFGSFNNMVKTNPEVVKIWAAILQAVPGSRLVLKSSQRITDQPTQDRFLDLFNQQGISQDRIIMHGWMPDLDSHLSLYHEIDIGLDTFPYNGTTTTCEALWKGVPVVTLMGGRHAGRVGASLLHQVGLDELVANSTEEYVRLAKTLANDKVKLAELRKGLRQQMQDSPLMDKESFTKELETAYRNMWIHWCEQQGQ